MSYSCVEHIDCQWESWRIVRSHGGDEHVGGRIEVRKHVVVADLCKLHKGCIKFMYWQLREKLCLPTRLPLHAKASFAYYR